ncbi:MAG: OmpA family protein [Helicobacteraceae bacterium]|nr:OmpA family protein [Helicobacteraceae bacterium]
MNKSLVGVAVAVVVVSGFFVLNSSKEDVKQSTIVKENSPQKSIVLKEKVSKKSTEPTPKVKVAKKKELKLAPSILSKVTDLDASILKDLRSDKDTFSELYNKNRLVVFVENELDYRKSKVNSTLNKIVSSNLEGIIKIREDSEGEIYLEIVDYGKNSNNSSESSESNYKKVNTSYNFKYDEATIQDIQSVEDFISFLNSMQGAVKSVIIVGYTDSKGSKNYNMVLSAKRAKVLNDMLKEYNFNVKYIAKGESNPIASNKNEETRALNRRVEVYVDVE